MSDEKVLVRRREEKKEKPPAWWVPYRWEILAALSLIVGLFLIISSGRLRTRLLAFLAVTMEALTGHLARLDTAVGAFLSQVTVADMLGAGLVVLAVGVILWRVRQRVLTDSALASLKCPRCGGRLHRIHRRPIDRLINRLVPVRRYTCATADCHWKGLRVGRGQGH